MGSTDSPGSPAAFQALFEGGKVAGAFDQLRRTRDQVESILQVVVGDDGVLVQDFTGRVVYANDPAARIMGCSCGQDLLRATTGELLSRVQFEDEAARRPLSELPGTSLLRGAAPSEQNLRVVSRKGKERLVTVRSLALHDDRGSIGSIVSIFRDVTEQRRASDFRDRLLGIASHDLRGPLSAISMAAAVMSRQPEKLDPRAAKALLQIQASCNRAVSIVHDLLDLTQGSLGQGIPVSPRRLDVAELVRGAVDEVSAAHPDRTVIMQYAVAGEANWDAGRVGQMLSNLLRNAITYGNPDAPITVRAVDKPEVDAIEIVVHNFGTVISPEQLARVFEPFVRGTDKYSSERSVGLGLYIVREVAHAHGGHIYARSSAENGTEFVVLLPRGRRPLQLVEG